MATNYTVKQGDHLVGIAHAFGFRDWKTIWNHPSNAALQSQRANPNVLFPGDTVFVPDPQLKEVSVSADNSHPFVCRVLRLKFRLVLRDQYELPIANALCRMTIGGAERQVTSDGSGKVELDIAPDAHEGLLVIQDPGTPFENLQIPFRVGDLDPPDTVSGQAARLNNLGYRVGEVATGDGARDTPADPDAYQSGVEEFQCDNGLTVDGICGPLTQDKLRQAHGS